jgi:hypothetical protein
MKKHFYWLLVLMAMGGLAGRGEDQPVIEPRAEKVLRDACQYLGESRSFIVSGEIWRERMMETGQKVEFTRTIDFHVRKPDSLHAEVRSRFSDRGFWYDGKSFVVLDRKRNFFSSADIHGHLDSALDRAHDEFGIDLPLMDLAVAEPYVNFTAKVQKGSYLGINPVLGVDCHHLAFTQENIDWQVWISEGPQPLIRKIVLTHKLESGAPEFTAVLTHWDFSTRIADSDFQFEAPSGSLKIPMENAAKRHAREETERDHRTQEQAKEEKK